MRYSDRLQLNRYLSWKKRAIILWDLLDDIDTLIDVIKPTDLEGYKHYYQAVAKRHKERFLILGSDGYKLFKPQRR